MGNWKIYVSIYSPCEIWRKKTGTSFVSRTGISQQ